MVQYKTKRPLKKKYGDSACIIAPRRTLVDQFNTILKPWGVKFYKDMDGNFGTEKFLIICIGSLWRIPRDRVFEFLFIDECEAVINSICETKKQAGATSGGRYQVWSTCKYLYENTSKSQNGRTIIMSAQSGIKTKMFLDACGLTSSCDDPYTQANDRVHWQRNIESPLKDNHYEFIYFGWPFVEQAVKFCKLLVGEGKKIIVTFTIKSLMLTLIQALRDTYPQINMGFVHGSLNMSEKDNAIELAKIKPYDIFLHTPTIDFGVSFEFET